MRNFRKFLVNRTPIQNFNQVRLLGGFTNLKFIVMLEVYTENNILIDIFSELEVLNIFNSKGVKCYIVNEVYIWNFEDITNQSIKL